MVANQIHELAGGDIFEIKTTYEYPAGYNDVLDQAQSEKNNNARPKLNAHVENMADFDTFFIGYPIWWGDMPMAAADFQIRLAVSKMLSRTQLFQKGLQSEIPM